MLSNFSVFRHTNIAVFYLLLKNILKKLYHVLIQDPPPFSLQYVPPDLCICTFVLEQSLSVRALQEMLAKSGQNSEGVSAGKKKTLTIIHSEKLFFSSLCQL